MISKFTHRRYLYHLSSNFKPDKSRLRKPFEIWGRNMTGFTYEYHEVHFYTNCHPEVRFLYSWPSLPVESQTEPYLAVGVREVLQDHFGLLEVLASCHVQFWRLGGRAVFIEVRHFLKGGNTIIQNMFNMNNSKTSFKLILHWLSIPI